MLFLHYFVLSVRIISPGEIKNVPGSRIVVRLRSILYQSRQKDDSPAFRYTRSAQRQVVKRQPNEFEIDPRNPRQDPEF
jgi:hypothetical protein